VGGAVDVGLDGMEPLLQRVDALRDALYLRLDSRLRVAQLSLYRSDFGCLLVLQVADFLLYFLVKIVKLIDYIVYLVLELLLGLYVGSVQLLD